MTWVRPELVIRAELGGWTRDGVVRQAAFKGLEPGRDATTVRRESAVATTSAVRAAEAETPAGADLGDDVADAPDRKDHEGRRSPPRPTKADGEGRTDGEDRRPPRFRSPPGLPRARRPEVPEAWRVSDAELAALDALGKEGSGGSVATSSSSPTSTSRCSRRRRSRREPVTKRELIRYFARIAPTMLPHLADRPLNLQRFPNGAGAPGLLAEGHPRDRAGVADPLARDRRRRPRGPQANDHLIADRAATLAWLGNQASFEIHAWTGRLPEPWQPTFAYIDIDPGEKTTWDETLVLARLYRTALGHLGVRGYPKTTGKRGIQIWIPIVPQLPFAETSAWVERVSRAVGSTVPDLISWEWAKGARKGRARLDYTQNASIKTLVAPYAVRPAPGAPVSAPIAWDELDDPDLRPDRWTIRTIVERVAERGDLFAAAQTDAQELPAV